MPDSIRFLVTMAKAYDDLFFFLHYDTCQTNPDPFCSRGSRGELNTSAALPGDFLLRGKADSTRIFLLAITLYPAPDRTVNCINHSGGFAQGGKGKNGKSCII
jgi:hypothetical protein